MSSNDQIKSTFDEAAEQAVALGNRLAEQNPDADAWDIASGLLAGVVHYWLYAHQPCGDPYCESCAEVATAEQRLRRLLDETRQSAEESDYYHTPHDSNVGTA
ncbi:MAG: hypothetical protein WC383_12780 [Gammaproteobacteria bacterium]